MWLGYNTNGLAHHDLLAAIQLLADIGYRGVGITLDHGALNPSDKRLAVQLGQVRDLLHRHQMRSVIETGARFLLDPRVKHEPTLMTAEPAGRTRRVDFLCGAIDIARQLGSDCVSFWSGVLRDRVNDEVALQRLSEGLRQVIDHAAENRVTLAFEPEPGMFIATMAHYERLLQWIDAPQFLLTVDVGHLYCQGEVPIADYISRARSRIANVHIEDMRAGVHEHLMFGEGEMDFLPIIDALAAVRYQGGVVVELNRHSHEGPTAAERAFEFLGPFMSPR